MFNYRPNPLKWTVYQHPIELEFKQSVWGRTDTLHQNTLIEHSKTRPYIDFMKQAKGPDSFTELVERYWRQSKLVLCSYGHRKVQLQTESIEIDSTSTSTWIRVRTVHLKTYGHVALKHSNRTFRKIAYTSVHWLYGKGEGSTEFRRVTRTFLTLIEICRVDLQASRAIRKCK